MELIIHRIDAFSDEQHKGNPAGVFYLTEDLATERLQRITFLAGLPVTAFIQPLSDGKFNIRWFTMNCEVNLCGHGTVAATYWLFKEFGLKEMHFESKSGNLTTRITTDGKVEMNFPMLPTTSCDNATKKMLEQTLGTVIKSVYFGYEDYLVELESGQAVANFVPDFDKIEKVDCRGIIITGWDKEYGYNCVSRFFCPRVAINEDQVCVSAHCKILPYWQEKRNVNYLHAWQASPNSGELHLYALDNNRVKIHGSAKVEKAVLVTL